MNVLRGRKLRNRGVIFGGVLVNRVSFCNRQVAVSGAGTCGKGLDSASHDERMERQKVVLKNSWARGGSWRGEMAGKQKVFRRRGYGRCKVRGGGEHRRLFK